jgi:PAS domain S-box-containing protein
MNFQLSEQMSALFDNVPIGIGMATIEGQILAANEALLEMTGYPEDEFVGRDVIEIYAEPELRTNLLKRLSDSKVIKDFGVKIKRKDDSQFFASLNVSQLHLDGQEVLLAVEMLAGNLSGA